MPVTPDFDPRQPFLAATALASGVTPKQLRGPLFRRLFRGVYVAAGTAPDPVQRVRAALLLHPPGAFASHSSAARLFGVPQPPGLDEEHVSVADARDRRPRAGVRSHAAPPGTPVVLFRGVRASSPAQLFVELARLLRLVDLVVVGDHLVRRGWVTPEQIVAHAARSSDAAARRAAGYVRGEVDSPMETRLRMLLVLAGLPEPVVNHVIRDGQGRVLMRFDLSYPDLRIVIEYDGRQHRADLDQWDRDEQRKDWFDDAGWRHVPVFSRGIYVRPDQTLARVVRALASRGVLVTPGDDWRPHFPHHASPYT